MLANLSSAEISVMVLVGLLILSIRAVLLSSRGSTPSKFSSLRVSISEFADACMLNIGFNPAQAFLQMLFRFRQMLTVLLPFLFLPLNPK